MKRVVLAAMCIVLSINVLGCGQKSELEEESVVSSIDDVKEEKEEVIAEEPVDEEPVVETAASNETQPLQIVNSGYSVKKDTLTGDKAYVHYWAILYNPNKNVAARFPKIQIVIQNPDGAVLATNEHTGMYVMPEDAVVLDSQCTLPLKDVTEETQVSITNPGAKAVAVDGEAIPKSTAFEITGITESEDMFSATVNGMIANNSSVDFGMVRLSAVYLKEDKIVYVDGTIINTLKAGASTAFSINVIGGVPEHDDVKVFAQAWG